MRKEKDINAASKVQEETKKHKDKVIEEVYFKFGGKILTKEAMLFHRLFDKNFSEDGRYYKGKRVVFEPVKTIKVREMRVVECKEKGKEEKTRKGI
jgi:hypothetical protein